jgi:hypothetical protein
MKEWPNQYLYQLCHHNLESAAYLCCRVPGDTPNLAESLQLELMATVSLAKLSQNAALTDWFSGLSGSSSSVKTKGARSLAILVCWTI